MVCVSDVNVELFLDVNLSKLKQFNFWSLNDYTSLLSCEKKICEVMATIWKVPFAVYTSTQNVSGYFVLTITMTGKVFTDSSTNGISTRILMTLRELSNQERAVFINKSRGSLTINFPLSICSLVLQLLHFLSLFISEL